MNRRGFLSSLVKGAAGLAVASVLPDPDRDLWVPGARTFFDLGDRPPDTPLLSVVSRQEDFHADFASPYWLPFPYEAITHHALQVLSNNLKLADRVNREYDQGFGETVLHDATTGIRVRIPDTTRFRAHLDDMFKVRIEYEIRDLVFTNPRQVCRVEG